MQRLAQEDTALDADNESVPIADAVAGDGSDLGSDTDTDGSKGTDMDEDDGDGSISSLSVGHLCTATHDHLGRPVQQMLPDNQLGMPSCDEAHSDSEPSPSKPGDVDTGCPEPEPESSADEEPTPPTHEEKLKSFWKKYVVSRPVPTSKYDEGSSSTSQPESKPPSPPSPDFSDHRDSDTLNLSDVGRDASDLESDVSFDSVVGEDEFHKAMELGGTSSHAAAAAGMPSMSTMETPRCSKPDPRMHTTNSKIYKRYTGDCVQDH